MVCNGSVCPCTQTEETYVCTDSQTVYLRDQMTRTPSLANLLILTMPPGTPSSQPGCMESWPFYVNTMSAATSTAIYSTLCISTAVTITAITAPLRQDPANRCTRYTTLAPSSASTVTCWQLFPTWFDSLVFYLIRLNCGVYFIRLNRGFVFIILFRFDSRLMYLFSIQVTLFESHSSQALGSPTFSRVSPKYPNTEIVEYSTIL